MEHHHGLGHSPEHDHILTANTDTHVLLRAFADELARCGMSHVCTSPGSRSTPLVLAFAGDGNLSCHSHIDERCAGFFALGVAKETGRPAAVICTSGTAAAELYPAVIEAREARIPLLLLTADRPPELRDIGAGQAIDQIKLYGQAVKWFFEVGCHPATAERVRWMRALACRAYWTTLDGRPGAVHLNWPLREPLIPDGPVPEPPPGRESRRPWIGRETSAPPPAAGEAEQLARTIGQRARGVVVAGRLEGSRELPEGVRRLAEQAGLPLLADPLSGARAGSAAIAHYDALLACEPFAASHAPDLIIRVGDLPTSKPLRAWLAANADAEQIALDPQSAWQDPDSVLSRVVTADPLRTLVAMTRWLVADSHEPATGWLRDWRESDRRALAAIDAVLSDTSEPQLSEPWVAAELGRALPEESTLFVASSMPVRDLESFWAVRDRPPRVLAHRGANGIDGTVSAAFGVAAARAGAPTVLLIGDVALAHDIGGLIAARRLSLDLTIVLLNNDGGGIFEFLPVAQRRDIFESHVATPHGLPFVHACELYGLRHHAAIDRESFASALRSTLGASGGGLIEVSTDRRVNVELHRRLRRAVSEATGR